MVSFTHCIINRNGFIHSLYTFLDQVHFGRNMKVKIDMIYNENINVRFQVDILSLCYDWLIDWLIVFYMRLLISEKYRTFHVCISHGHSRIYWCQIWHSRFPCVKVKKKVVKRKGRVESALRKAETFKIRPTALRCNHFYRTCVVNSFF